MIATEDLQLNELIQTLMDFANDFEENYKEHLTHNGRYTLEYGLLDSVKTEVRGNGKGYEVTLTLNDYWKYVENDTKPHFPPPDAIKRWIEIKPIIPRPDKNGKLPTTDQLAFLIGRKIAREGTKGSHDYRVTRENLIPWYRDRIKAALGHDVEAYILKVVHDVI